MWAPADSLPPRLGVAYEGFGGVWDSVLEATAAVKLQEGAAKYGGSRLFVSEYAFDNSLRGE